MPSFDMSQLTSLGIYLAGISICVIALVLLGSVLWKEEAQRYKKLILDVILGMVLLMVGGGLIATIASSLQ